jgi:hypothetical protein
VFQRRSQDYRDWFSGQQVPEEEGQAAVWVFLSVVPFQILKSAKRHSREIISNEANRYQQTVISYDIYCLML